MLWILQTSPGHLHACDVHIRPRGVRQARQARPTRGVPAAEDQTERRPGRDGHGEPDLVRKAAPAVDGRAARTGHRRCEDARVTIEDYLRRIRPADAVAMA